MGYSHKLLLFSEVSISRREDDIIEQSACFMDNSWSPQEAIEGEGKERRRKEVKESMS